MALDWENMFRRYVFDAEKTPYFTAVDRLTQSQARSEILVFALFVAVFFVIVGVLALAGRLPDRDALIVPVYAFFTAWTALAFYWTRNQMAAAFAALAPLAVLVYCLVFGFAPGLALIDKILISAVLLAWFRYSWRIVGIAQAYPTMAVGAPPRRGRRNPFG